MNDKLSGIETSGGEEVVSHEDEQVDELASELSGIGNKEDIIETLEEEVGIKGIQKVLQGGGSSEGGGGISRSRVQKQNEQKLLEEQLSELEDVSSDADLLRNIAARLSTLNSTVDTLSTQVSGFNTDFTRENNYTLKDTGNVTIESAEKAESVVKEDNLSTDFVIVKAHHRNDGMLYVGGEGVSVSEGFFIEGGTSERIPVDLSNEILNIVAEDSDEQYSYMAFGGEV